jgi:hypothetical protein
MTAKDSKELDEFMKLEGWEAAENGCSGVYVPNETVSASQDWRVQDSEIVKMIRENAESDEAAEQLIFELTQSQFQ